MRAQTGVLVADSDITGATVIDPIVGVFTWKACDKCDFVNPGGGTASWWRPFMLFPQGTNQAFYIFEWGCL